ncbi:unnamed protein product [Hymenolepis diminuta]|uniref:Uncharacterized protein n=1 Tax=Hymenolepis diminuta TaxID=6216 RepID=A0A564Z8W4_HYMDI|nr:unnamed protein product [Hymenolepis diminuta]
MTSICHVQTRPSISPSVVSPKKYICAHVLTRSYLSDSYRGSLVFHSIITHTCQLPAPTLPAHLLSSSTCSPPYLSLSLSHLFQTRFNFLNCIFTQTATNW